VCRQVANDLLNRIGHPLRRLLAIVRFVAHVMIAGILGCEPTGDTTARLDEGLLHAPGVRDGSAFFVLVLFYFELRRLADGRDDRALEGRSRAARWVSPPVSRSHRA
jgi:hypothetical protein